MSPVLSRDGRADRLRAVPGGCTTWPARVALALLGLILLACGSADDEPDLRGSPYLNQLGAEHELEALSVDGMETKVKFVLRVQGAQPLLPFTEDCYFQNMRLFSWHLQFLQSFPGHAMLTFDDYRTLVLGASTRRLWGGTLQRWPGVPHPDSGHEGVLSYLVYADGALSVDAVAQVDARLKGCMPFARMQLVFVPETPAQTDFLEREQTALLARGVSSLFPAALQGPTEDEQDGASHQ